MVVRSVVRSGNSNYVSIPEKFLTALDLKRKDYLILTIEKGAIVMKPLRNRITEEEAALDIAEEKIPV
jgi:antitoxin component of MazEF toxin-antitoxin module